MGKCCYLGKRKLYELAISLLSDSIEIADFPKCEEFFYRDFNEIEELKNDYISIKSEIHGKYIDIYITEADRNERGYRNCTRYMYADLCSDGVYQYHNFSYMVH